MSSPREGAPRPRFFYGWVIVGLSFTTLAFHLTARFSFSIFQVPLIAEFGWSRGALGGAYALMLGVYALSCPFLGALLDKRGPRAVIPWGSVLIGLGLTMSFFVTSLWHVYLFTGLLIGLGNAMSGFATHSALMPRWFQRRRGLATGIVVAGSGIGALVFSPTIERLIALVGWRSTYLIFGLVLLVGLTAASFLLLRNRPEDVGQARDGLPPREPPREAPPDSTAPAPGAAPAPGVWEVFQTVKKDKRFWAILFIVFTIGLNNNTILSQLQLYLVDAKFSTAAAALLLGATGFVRMLGSAFAGWLSDHIGRQRAQALAAFISAFGVVFLLLIPVMGASLASGLLFAVVYGFGMGGMGACHSAMAADCFGGKSFGAVIGISEIGFGMGGILGPPLAGFIFDATGSYILPFSLVVLMLLAALFTALLTNFSGGRPGAQA